MYSFTRLTLDEFERHPIRQAIPEETIFQTPEWLRFLSATQDADPVISLVQSGTRAIGYFTGGLVVKCGIRILGSPFPGWSTGYTGFTLSEQTPHSSVLESFLPWAFTNLRCVHIEMMDRNIGEHAISNLGLQFRREEGFEINLKHSEDELFQQMTHQCRTNTRKAVRAGLMIEEAHDTNFANDYYDQLVEVFGKRHLVPTFPRMRVAELVSRFAKNSKCLFLRARNQEGRCVATTIMLGGGKMAYLWGAASLSEFQILRPNELLYWTVIKRARELGLERLDMGGAGDYKAKYGGVPIVVPWFQLSRFSFIPKLRSAAQTMVGLRQRALGRLAHHG